MHKYRRANSGNDSGNDIHIAANDVVTSLTTPIGDIGVCIANDLFCGLRFLLSPPSLPSLPSLLQRRSTSGERSDAIQSVSRLAERVIDSLQQYFVDPYFRFSLPLHIVGTSLQLRIWEALREIPIGSVVTYGDLAKEVKTSPRVIGNACRCNRFPIIVPCHRVVGAHGLGGYAGEVAGNARNLGKTGKTVEICSGALQKKQWLLQHEKASRVF